MPPQGIIESAYCASSQSNTFSTHLQSQRLKLITASAFQIGLFELISEQYSFMLINFPCEKSLVLVN